MASKRDEYGGAVYDRQYFTDEELRQAAAVRAAAERGETDWDSAHDYVERTRSRYGYSGGADGGSYLRLDGGGASGEAERPGWDESGAVSRALERARQAVEDRAPFSYDYTVDPAWQAYRKEYVREGRRAGEDALAKASVLTGGVPSSYAQTAAQQASNEYAARLSDKLPELYQLAYEMYADEGERLMKNYNAARQAYADAYGRYRDALGDWEDRHAASERRALGAAETLAELGDYSGYEDYYGLTGLQDRYDRSGAVYAFADDGSAYEIGSALGRQYLASLRPGQRVTGGDGSTWEMDALGNIHITKDGKVWRILSEDAYGEDGGYGGGSSGGSGNGSNGSGRGSSENGSNKISSKGGSASESAAPTDTAQNQLRLFMDALNSGVSPANYIATHYKEYGFDKVTGLSSEYNKWVRELKPTSPQDWEIGPAPRLPGYRSGYGTARLENR